MLGPCSEISAGLSLAPPRRAGSRCSRRRRLRLAAWSGALAQRAPAAAVALSACRVACMLPPPPPPPCACAHTHTHFYGGDVCAKPACASRNASSRSSSSLTVHGIFCVCCAGACRCCLWTCQDWSQLWSLALGSGAFLCLRANLFFASPALSCGRGLVVGKLFQAFRRSCSVCAHAPGSLCVGRWHGDASALGLPTRQARLVDLEDSSLGSAGLGWRLGVAAGTFGRAPVFWGTGGRQ